MLEGSLTGNNTIFNRAQIKIQLNMIDSFFYRFGEPDGVDGPFSVFRQLNTGWVMMVYMLSPKHAINHWIE